jgi:hypothetical protein
MLGLARWGEKGGSYRSLQRFYQTPIDWLLLHWLLFKTWFLRSEGVYQSLFEHAMKLIFPLVGMLMVVVLMV